MNKININISNSFNKISIKISDYQKDERIRQVVVLYFVNFIGIPLGIVTSIIITKYLGAQDYGDYSFINNIFSFAITIFTFGFFHAGSRALVLSSNEQNSKEIYGASLTILAALFLLMGICLLFYSHFDSNLHKKGLTEIFISILPFSFVFLLTNYFETLFQADNKINELAKSRLFPKIGFFISALIIYIFFEKIKIYKLGLILSLYLFTFIISYIQILKGIKLSFSRLRYNILEVWKFNKSFGLDVYLGSIVAVGISSLSGVFISYFGKDNSGVGFYLLAITFASPLTLIPNVIATTHYKDFAMQKKIPLKLTKITIGMTLAALITLWIIVGPFIDIFYGSSFHSVIKLNLIVSIGFACQGLADYFNRFFGAHGQGKILRNSSIIIGIIIFASNIILIPNWGEQGAAYSSLIGGTIYLVNMLISYKLYYSNK